MYLHGTRTDNYFIESIYFSGNDSQMVWNSNGQMYRVRSGTKSILRFRGLGNTSTLQKLFFKTLSFVSWRCFHVFESSHPSFFHNVFFGAPLPFPSGIAMDLHVVESFLCLRVLRSSIHRLRYILGQVLDVWGHILYRLYLHKLGNRVTE